MKDALKIRRSFRRCATSPFAARELDAGIQKIVGDKVYDSDPLRKSLRKDGITPVIPARADRNNSSGPVLVLSARGVPAHCYDKLAQKPFSVPVLAAVV
jgi:hypothetical protein